VPNAINPNSTIVENRTFQPKYAFVSGDYELVIFDRYGSRIFTSHDIQVGWDGMVHGNPQPAGAYQYKITIKMPNGMNIERLGSVNVVYE
jgi:gliding motility-associated-like protein